MLNTLNQWTHEHYAIIKNGDTGEFYNHKRGRWEPMDESRWEEFVHRVEQIPTRFIAAETKTAEPEAPAAAPTAEPAPAEEKKALDEAKEDAEPRPTNGGAKPPHEGRCRQCGMLRQLNRLRLCYPCWAIMVLMDECKKRGVEWKPGDKHPDFCSCEGLGEHKNEDGTARGFN